MRTIYDMHDGTITKIGTEPSQNELNASTQRSEPEVELRLQEVEWSVDTPKEPAIWATGISIKDLLK